MSQKGAIVATLGCKPQTDDTPNQSVWHPPDIVCRRDITGETYRLCEIGIPG